MHRERLAAVEKGNVPASLNEQPLQVYFRRGCFAWFWDWALGYFCGSPPGISTRPAVEKAAISGQWSPASTYWKPEQRGGVRHAVGAGVAW